MKKFNLLLAYCLISWVSFSQEKAPTDVNLELPKMSYLDSLKATFVNHKTSACIDERWMAELSNNEIFEEMFADVTETDIDSTVTYDLSTDVLKQRLQKLDSKTPFTIDYTPALENVIKSFLKNRKTSFERLMAISEYYFPMFEEHLAKYNIPIEIKYLAIVESALNPKAKSRVGATGLWQFMYPTGKQYNLEVNSYVDERFDPIKATEAACQYMTNLYEIFGDWSMVLASYNAGPGNVSKAIRRSGGKQNYWNIRKYLPRETANYVPLFLATMYVCEYAKEHGINAKKAPVTYFETDTIAVKQQLTFQQVSDLLDIPLEEIEFLNPIYKLGIIPYVADEMHSLRLPKSKLGLFVSNEDKVYAYATHMNTQKETIQTSVLASSSASDEEVKIKYHKIRRGESIGLIASKYNVSVTNLKKWNRMRSNKIQAGATLKIYTNSVSSASKTVVSSGKNATYTVRKGDSLFSIARKFPGISAEDIKKWNDISGNNIQPGMKLKING